jgi:hypothetical protein
MASADVIDAFCEAWADPGRRPALAVQIGDWLAAEALDSSLHGKAELCRAARRERLRRDLNEPYRGADALQALADLSGPDLDQHLEDALRGPVSGLTSTALDIIGKRNDPRWCPAVHTLFSRIEARGPIPQPHVWMTSLKFLLRHGHHDLLPALLQAGGPVIGEAVLLALEHAPEFALPLIRKGLHSDIPINQSQVAAILALIARPWSRRELLSALEASDEQEKTADVRAALLESGDEEAQNAVLAWEERNPHEKETGSYLEIRGRKLGPFYTFGELSLKHRASWIRYEMEQLHDRVMKIRHVIPPE